MNKFLLLKSVIYIWCAQKLNYYVLFLLAIDNFSATFLDQLISRYHFFNKLSTFSTLCKLVPGLILISNKYLTLVSSLEMTLHSYISVFLLIIILILRIVLIISEKYIIVENILHVIYYGIIREIYGS